VLADITKLIAVIGRGEIGRPQSPSAVPAFVNKFCLARESYLPALGTQGSTKVHIFIPGGKESFVETVGLSKSLPPYQ